MFNEPRNWKWIIPGILSVLFFVGWQQLVFGGSQWANASLLLAGLFFVATVVNVLIYLSYYFSDDFAKVRQALYSTPEVRMFEAAKGMHPDAVKALLMHRRTIWRMKYVPVKDLVDWIFDDVPTVHAGFAEYAIRQSRGGAFMAKRLLVDGSKVYDPAGLTTDYQQYDDLVRYMQSRLMITQAYGNQPPRWIPPWNADLALHVFGLDGGVEEVPQTGVDPKENDSNERPDEQDEPDEPEPESPIWKLPKADQILLTEKDLNAQARATNVT